LGAERVQVGLRCLQCGLQSNRFVVPTRERGIEVGGAQTSQPLVTKFDGLDEGDGGFGRCKSALFLGATEILDLEQQVRIGLDGGLCFLAVLGLDFKKRGLDAWIERNYACDGSTKSERFDISWPTRRTGHRMQFGYPRPQRQLTIGAEALGYQRARGRERVGKRAAGAKRRREAQHDDIEPEARRCWHVVVPRIAHRSMRAALLGPGTGITNDSGVRSEGRQNAARSTALRA